MMTIIRKVIISLLNLGLFCSCLSQTGSQYSQDHFDEIYALTKRKYEANKILLNGIYYDHPYHTARGHEFLFDESFQQGNVTYCGETFKEIRLNYDIFNQRLLIMHSQTDETFVTILPGDRISDFQINDQFFKHLNLSNEFSGFFHVIAEEPGIQCYYMWYKKRYKSSQGEAYLSYIFSDRKRKHFLVINEEPHRYFNNGSFVKSFPENQRSSIRKYLTSNKIKVVKADETIMKSLIGHCQYILHHPTNQ